MSYYVKENEGAYDIVEKDTDTVIDLKTNEKRARDIRYFWSWWSWWSRWRWRRWWRLWLAEKVPGYGGSAQDHQYIFHRVAFLSRGKIVLSSSSSQRSCSSTFLLRYIISFDASAPERSDFCMYSVTSFMSSRSRVYWLCTSAIKAAIRSGKAQAFTALIICSFCCSLIVSRRRLLFY